MKRPDVYGCVGWAPTRLFKEPLLVLEEVFLFKVLTAGLLLGTRLDGAPGETRYCYPTGFL